MLGLLHRPRIPVQNKTAGGNPARSAAPPPARSPPRPDTSAPACMRRHHRRPSSSPRESAPAACRRSRYAGTPGTASSSFACVPLPEPGAPNRYEPAFTGATAQNSAPPAANPARPRRKAFIVAHDQLRFDLVDRVHGHTHHDQQRCAAEVKIHAQAVQQQPREIRVDPVADQRQVLQLDARRS